MGTPARPQREPAQPGGKPQPLDSRGAGIQHHPGAGHAQAGQQEPNAEPELPFFLAGAGAALKGWLRLVPAVRYILDRVSEPACFGTAPAPGIFTRSWVWLLVKENKSLDFLKLTTNCLKYVLTHVPVHVVPNLDLL